MKYGMMVFCGLTLILSAQAHASCASAALWAAETAYGNDPMRTETRQLTSDTYEVTVGIGNPEDGAHTYQVTFEPSSCNPRTALVCDRTAPENNDPRVCHE